MILVLSCEIVEYDFLQISSHDFKTAMTHSCVIKSVKEQKRVY